ncbi:hypothetical protein B0H11DRAFT_2227154 [Mycena galericulata]|nr:hypothetical protein B0H11DRAFT_2227154 [Mycena galericulata]
MRTSLYYIAPLCACFGPPEALFLVGALVIFIRDLPSEFLGIETLSPSSAPESSADEEGFGLLDAMELD